MSISGIKKLVIGLAEIYGEAMTQSRLELYASALADLSVDEIEKAVAAIIRDPAITRFPLLAVLRTKAKPEVSPDHEAIEASNRIVEAINRFGFYRPEDAEKFIGELGWLVVQREGGWPGLCERVMSDQLPILKAQWRELAKALQARSKAGRLESAPALPKPVNRTADLVRIGEIMPKRNGGTG